jgi:hypothetical protein
MKIGIRKKVNPTTELFIEFDEERDLKEAILKATPFINLPSTCGLCHSDNISLQARKTKDDKGQEFIYVEAFCKACFAKKSFGEYVQPKGALFLKGDWNKYVPKNQPPEETKSGDEPF